MRNVKNCSCNVFAILFAMFIFCFIPLTGRAETLQQEGKISGVVLDENHEPVIGATVVVKENKSVGTVTDIDGNFNINVKIGSTLIISYVGYESKSIKVRSDKPLRIELGLADNQLEELLVVGYNKVKRANLTGAVIATSSKDMQSTVTSDVANSLTGRAPGVRVAQYSSEPGSFDTDIDVRGFGEPLFIIDGVERSKAEFSRMSASEIESVSVLKDGTAAIYGVKAANGVLLVTTKKGQKSKPSISYSMRVGVQAVTRFMESASAYDYAMMKNEKIINGAIRGHSYLRDPENVHSQFEFSEDDLNYYRSSEFPNINTMDELFDKSAVQHQHTLNVRGGSDKVRYFISAGYFKDNGLFSSNDLSSDKYNFRVNLDNELAKGLTLSLNLGFINTLKDGLNSSNFDIFKYAVTRPPVYSLYANNNRDYLATLPNGELNSMALIDREMSGFNDDDDKFLQTTFALKWNVPYVKGLSASLRYSYDYINYYNRKYRKPYNLYTYDENTEEYIPREYNGPSNVSERIRQEARNNFRAQIEYNRDFNGHNLGVLALFEQRYTSSRETTASTDVAINDVPELAPGISETNKVGSNFFETANISYVGRISYDYKSRYLVDFSCRYDGSSKYPAHSRWGFFPSVSGAWRISEEAFVKNKIKWMDNLKLRFSWGKLGDDRASKNQFITGFDYPSKNGWLFGDSWTTGVGLRDIPNPDLTWYTSKTIDLGLDLSVFNSKLYFTADYFRRTREGLLGYETLSLPGYFGATLPQKNLNGDRSSGYELVLGHKNKVNDFSYSIEANVSYTRTKNLHVEETPARDSYQNWTGTKTDRYQNQVWIYETDGLFKSFEEIDKAPRYEGVFQRQLLPGDPKIVDQNGDGVIDSKDKRPLGIGGNKPLYYFGFNIDMQYKGFDLKLLFQGGAKNYITYTDYPLKEPFAFGHAGFDKELTDRWYCHDLTNPYKIESWTPGKYPSVGAMNSDQYRNSDLAYFDAKYLRLKNIELGYSIPKKALKKCGISNCRLYINAYNLLTFANSKSYLDPEVNAGRQYSYPVTRNINFGLDLTF